MSINQCFCLLLVLFGTTSCQAQTFYFGADLSYVNEMEDCGVIYQEDQQAKDPYLIFADHGNNLVRLRLWHTPGWYDALNAGNRYSDFADVKRSIARAKEADMEVLLDFHLSDNWADPSKQVVPAAWASVVDDQETLGDSVYNYIYASLGALHSEGLLPEMVQIGNETNRGILLSQEVNDMGWTLDWERNSYLFNRAISAVRDFEQASGESIKVALHLAGPANVEWFVEQFVAYGVTDFDVLGMSYYWAWHQPTTIEETGAVITQIRQDYPDKEVIIFETGYIWTQDYNDNAANIISDLHEDYSPASPAAQKQWLVDLTQEVMSSGGHGVIYWEPAWVSSDCWTQWGQGSHQEHATFFDFDNNLIEEGGISWMQENYDPTVIREVLPSIEELSFTVSLIEDGTNVQLILSDGPHDKDLQCRILHLDGKVMHQQSLAQGQATYRFSLPAMSSGLYFVALERNGRLVGKEKLLIMR